MRVAPIWVIVLAACASGNSPAEPDAAVQITVDARACGDLPCDAIYVAKSGSDNGAGTAEAPLRTISAAIVNALATNPPRAVFVQAGQYMELVTMRSGIALYGGFDATWTRDAAQITEIAAPSPAVVFESVTGAALDRVTIKSADATMAGASSYAVVIKSSSQVELRDVVVTPGAGAPGTDGSDGM